MNVDINLLFQKKNFEIIKKKLNLDINNNADSLNHTMSNFIDLKELNLYKYITELYKDLNIIYDEKKLKSLLKDESNTLKEIMLKHIEERKEKINDYLEEDVDVTKIDDEYLTKYHEHIDNLTEIFDKNIEVSLREEICTKYSVKVVKLYKLKEEHSKEILLEYINSTYCNLLIDKVENEALLRNTTLKNLSRESFERFKSMNEKTVE